MKAKAAGFSFVAVVCLLMAGSAWGKVIYVDDDAPTGGDGTSWTTAYRFLQDALTDARAAGEAVEVRVAQGTYKPDRSAARPEGGTGGGSVYFLLTDGMSLLGGYAGLAGADPNERDIQSCQTILSGDLLGNDAPVADPADLQSDTTRDDNRLVVYMRGDNVRLDGCTVTGGADGGGLWARSETDGVVSTLIICDCTFVANRGFGGTTVLPGGVWATGAVLTRCSFIENGGARGALDGHDVLVEDCQFVRNYGDWAGGGAAYGRRATFTNCVFTDNRTVRDGGALYLLAYPSEINRVIGCVFRGNSAGRGGGAIVADGDLEVESCSLVANGVLYRGGAGWQLDGTVLLANCVFAGNRSGDHGAAWSSGVRDSLEVRNCTFSGNRSGKGHYLVINSLPHAAISSSILSSEKSEAWSWDLNVEVKYTCVHQDANASSDPNMWLKWGPGNVEVDPCFADAGYWDPNGTPDDPNDDFFVEGDYHLKSQAGRWDSASGTWVQDEVTSPCIDAGDPNSPIGYEPFPNGGRINMGAYGGTSEASKSYSGEPVSDTIIAGDINGDGKVDWLDLDILARNWLRDVQE